MTDLVTVAIFEHEWEARLLKSRLEAAGIFATIVPEGLGMLTFSLRVRVDVREDQLQKALKVKGEKGTA